MVDGAATSLLDFIGDLPPGWDGIIPHAGPSYVLLVNGSQANACPSLKGEQVLPNPRHISSFSVAQESSDQTMSSPLMPDFSQNLTSYPMITSSGDLVLSSSRVAGDWSEAQSGFGSEDSIPSFSAIGDPSLLASPKR